ncbi:MULTISPECIES: EscI/YscI/HrpB family type III secretion system inner rod protein [Pseudomonas]|jgi:hypothetical protein|uniref:EscI/YscI/HrpB family type III secretion system inner rod protein n=1 Tax=Pseudomonas TaxID=286 RepID=UPI0008EF7EE3|nr:MULTISPECIES: EscI/YscI/HrpB family type III secretion system inner rod protein [Pseudomonas]QDH63205.1 type III secretion apparatus protein RspB [Pseudomonas azotoformans]SFS27510.1 Type III secretion basal body protein I, YscI, HrpB, PscI [Pseudomonas sp. NFACC42-2]
MQIEAFDFSTLNKRRGGIDVTQKNSISSTDVSFFASMLEGSKASTPAVAPPAVLAMLAEHSSYIENKKIRLARALKSSSKGMDSEKFREYPRELSNVALTTQLLVKSLGKTSQCIDKICNMQ